MTYAIAIKNAEGRYADVALNIPDHEAEDKYKNYVMDMVENGTKETLPQSVMLIDDKGISVAYYVFA